MRSRWLLMMAACGTEYAEHEEEAPFVCPEPSNVMKVVQRLTPVEGEADTYHLPHPACSGDLLVIAQPGIDPWFLPLNGGEQKFRYGFSLAWELANVTATFGLDQRTDGDDVSTNERFDGGTVVTTEFPEIAIATLDAYVDDDVAIMRPFDQLSHVGSQYAAIAIFQDQATKVTASWARSDSAPLPYRTRLWTLKTY